MQRNKRSVTTTIQARDDRDTENNDLSGGNSKDKQEADSVNIQKVETIHSFFLY